MFVFICHLFPSAAALAWPCAKGSSLWTASFGCVWHAETCSGLRLPAPLSWFRTPMPRWTYCTLMWAPCSQCSLLLRRSRPGWKPLIQTVDTCLLVLSTILNDPVWIWHTETGLSLINIYVFPQVQQNWLSVPKRRNYAKSTSWYQRLFQGPVFQVNSWLTLIYIILAWS